MPLCQTSDGKTHYTVIYKAGDPNYIQVRCLIKQLLECSGRYMSSRPAGRNNM